jgi:hypothetical protein
MALQDHARMMLTDLPPAFFRQVNAEFAGEKILWAGQPDARKAFWTTTPIWLFAVPWAVFTFAWEYIALAAFIAEGSQAPTGAGRIMAWVFPIFGLPFVAVGLGLMSTPIWCWWKARNTVYALTEQRVVTLIAGPNLNVSSIDVTGITSVHRIEKRNGSGTLHLNMGSYRDSDGDSMDKKITLPDVPDVRELERLIVEKIRNLRQEARRS